MTILIFNEAQFTDNPNVSQIVRIYTDSNLATVQGAGWLNPSVSEGYVLSPKNLYLVSYNSGANVAFFNLTVTNAVYTLALQTNSIVGPSVVTTAVTSATPGTVRSLVGKITESATTMTSGNIVGVRGEADMVGASGGFVYGVQGKVIPTGTLSGSVWIAAVFAQFDLSHPAVINGAQLAAVWGDWGATGGTATDLSGCRGFAFTNTTANVLNAQQYMYGNATYLLELAGAGGTLNYYKNAGTSGGSAGDAAHCAAQKVIEIEVNGAAAYIPIFTQNS